MDISIMNRWANYFFPMADWQDKNRNGRVEKKELQVPDVFMPISKKVENNIAKTYFPLLREIDKNNDGISFEEIQRYINVPKIDFNKIDINAAVKSLKTTGQYKVPNMPVLLVTDDKIPEGIKNSKYYPLFMEVMGRGNAATMDFSVSGGQYIAQPLKNANKICVCVFPKRRIINEPEDSSEEVIRHELMHAKNRFNGETGKLGSISGFMSKNYAFIMRPKVLSSIEVALPKALSELGPTMYSIKRAVAKKNLQYISYFCRYINMQFYYINSVKSVFNAAKSFELVKVTDSMIADIVTKEEIDKLNKEMEKLTHDKGNHIYPDITQDQLIDIYSK